MNGLRILTGLSAVVCMGFVPSGRADVVSDWNLFAVVAINAAGRPAGGSPFLDIATVHLAIHDAVAAIDHQFQPYNVTISGASGSLVAAAAAAAHDVLVNRFPAQAESLDSAYSEYIGGHGLSQNDPGIAVGRRAAAGIIAFRANDGSFPSQAQPPFTGGSASGQWRPTPPAL